MIPQLMTSLVSSPYINTHRLRRAASWLLVSALLLMSPSSLSQAAALPASPPKSQSNKQSDRKLVFGETVERQISGGDFHQYQFDLEAGQYLRLVVEQRGAEVTTALFGEGGELLIEVDSASKETVSVIAPRAAGYRVVVRARQRNGAAGRYLIRIEEQRAAAPQDETRVSAERLMADAMQLSRQPDKDNLRLAGEKYQAALGLWRALPDRHEEARALYLLGLAHQDGGETQAALEEYLRSLEVSRAEGDREREHLALSALGTLYFTLGDKGKAIDCYTQSLAFSQQQADRTLEASLLVNLGVAYKALGENAKALDFYQRALRLARAVGNQAMEAAVLTNLARLYDLTGDKQNSIVTNQQALVVWRTLGNKDGEATTLKNLGSLAESDGRLSESFEYFSQALALSQALGDGLREAHIRADLARVARAGGSFADSRAQIEQTLMIIESMRGQLLNPDLRASFTAANRRYYEFYVDLLMQQHQLQSSNEAAARAGRNPAPNYAAEALRVSESAHARALADLIAEARLDIRQGVDPDLLGREQALAQTLTAKKAERTALVRRKVPAEELDPLNREILALSIAYEQAKTEIKRASPRYAALVYPEPVGLADIQQQLLDPDTLLLEYALGKERSYLWVVGRDCLRSFTLPGREAIEEQARQYYDRLAARGETVRFEKPEQKLARIAAADRELHEAASALSQTLVGPAADLLGQRRLLIVGDGMLNYIPFAALPDPAEGRRDAGTRGRGDAETGRRSGPLVSQSLSPSLSAQPLLVKHEIINLPSASVLAELRRDSPDRRKAANDLAVIADPVFSRNDDRFSFSRTSKTLSNSPKSDDGDLARGLPDLQNSPTVTEALASTLRTGSERDAQNLSRLRASRQEAERITRLASGSRNLLALDFQANRGLVTGGALSEYRVLHFATHGLLNSQMSELSGLVFSLVDEKGQPQSGVLRLNDIYNLKLAADLVVLSACRTGLGKEVRGEGAISLPRGFMYAGVPRVVSSLWSVDDGATAELMTRFYDEMLSGQKSPAAALRAAQLSLWGEKKWQAPYFWAGFVLQGEPK